MFCEIIFVSHAKWVFVSHSLKLERQHPQEGLTGGPLHNEMMTPGRRPWLRVWSPAQLLPRMHVTSASSKAMKPEEVGCALIFFRDILLGENPPPKKKGQKFQVIWMNHNFF